MNPVFHRPPWILIAAAAFAFTVCSPARGVDCDSNGVDDTAEIAAGSAADCNSNGVLDTCDSPGDFDGDGLVQAGVDFAAFAACQTAPCPNAPCTAPLYVDACCALADHDTDGDVDLADYRATQLAVLPLDCNSNGVSDFQEMIPIFIEHPVGPHPRQFGLIAADMDGDGDADVLAVRRPGVTYFENTNGLGGFGEPRDLPAFGVNQNSDVAAADLDGDDDHDVVIVSNAAGFVWLENLDGNAEFPIFPRRASSGNASFVVTADVDGDGDIDLVGRTRDFVTFVDALSWYENKSGLGDFGEQNVISPPGATNAVAADIDGDGDVDLVTDQVSWFENTNGLGQFGPEQIVSTSGVLQVVVADLDADGDLDLVSRDVVNTTGRIVQYENTDGLGSFASPTVISGSAEDPIVIVAADLDNDGDNDVAATLVGESELGWYEKLEGKAVYSPLRQINSQTIGLAALTAADVDGDGDTDLIAGSNFADMLVWFENTGADCNGNGLLDVCELASADCNANGILDECELRGGRAKDCNSNGIPDACDIAMGTTADCNSNGIDDRCESANDCDENGAPDDCDLATGTSADCNSNGQPDECDTRTAFGPLQAPNEVTIDFAFNTAAADLDGDQDLDLATARYDGGVAWIENTNGAGGFTIRFDSDLSSDADGATAVQLTDIDGDGDNDVISGSVHDNKVAWYPNDGSGSFGGQVVVGAVPLGNRNTGFDRMFLDVGDVDGDGDPDIVSSASSDDVVAWYSNTNGFGGFGARQIIAVAADPRGVHLADLDGDDDLDVISVSQGDGAVAWYANTNGVGGFGSANMIASYGAAAWWVAAGDLDGDFDQDVLLASPGGLIAWHENINTSGVFGPPIPIFEGAFRATEVIAVDLDMDGDLDVVSASQDDHTVRWYENLDGSGAFAFPVDFQPISRVGSVIAADIDGDGDPDLVGSSRSSASVTQVAWFPNQFNDCNRNDVPDSCDIAASAALDCNSNTVIDFCEPFKAGDFDGDSAVDAADWSSFEQCLGGPDQGVSGGAACPGLCIAAFDSDTDGDLDLRDFGEFVRRFDVP